MTLNLEVFFAFAKPFFGGGRGVLMLMKTVSLPERNENDSLSR